MENTPLHAQKVTILSRLIKESSLTLEEALVLLKEEEIEEETVINTTPAGTSPWTTTTTPYIQPYTQWPYSSGSGSITFSSGGNVGHTTVNPASSFTLTTTSDTVDLNN